MQICRNEMNSTTGTTMLASGRSSSTHFMCTFSIAVHFQMTHPMTTRQDMPAFDENNIP
jgi:hypothetical protein